MIRARVITPYALQEAGFESMANVPYVTTLYPFIGTPQEVTSVLPPIDPNTILYDVTVTPETLAEIETDDNLNVLWSYEL